MKVFTSIFSLLLTEAIISTQVLAGPESVSSNTCCYTFTQKKIPLKKLVSYRKITSSKCPRNAVILLTIQNREICADPMEKWVQDHIAKLSQKMQLNQKAQPNQKTHQNPTQPEALTSLNTNVKTQEPVANISRTGVPSVAFNTTTRRVTSSNSNFTAQEPVANLSVTAVSTILN
ncbi:C-C motif chemokine 2-like [Perognathus longimembris pacificus]|uniref:C-C motif chemokine 2-like n=1 Tax=Perognathus longimembris pacificus TaxID=214514 RepID=UPI0020196396|nr:C-C motif chemokine 2-like [Perognathus longimembris pacificus]